MPVGSNRTIGVRPMMRHPPGPVRGYTPVCDPAMPTDPAGTRNRGTSRRDAAIEGSTSPRYGNPGLKPSMNTRYVAAAWRSRTSSSLNPAHAATSGRSGPNGPPYRTGIVTVGSASSSVGGSSRDRARACRTTSTRSGSASRLGST